MIGGWTSAEDMIRSTDRGVLLTRLFYLRMVDPRTLLVTGLTRDGTLLIENGKISHAIENFRFNESPVHAEQRRGDRSRGARRGDRVGRRHGDARAQGEELQLHVAVGRGMTRKTNEPADRGLVRFQPA
jgi:hypothetical protein